MKYSELIELYFERSTALQWYWTIYVLVIGGVLAFSTLRLRKDRITSILVAVLYACFAYKNLGAIHDVTLQRMAVLQSVKDFPASGADAPNITQVRGTIEPTLVAPAYEGIRNFHITTDVLTLMAIWAMERRRRKAELVAKM